MYSVDLFSFNQGNVHDLNAVDRSLNRMQNVTRQSNCINNVRNNLLKKVEGKEADLSNVGNDLSL